MTELRKQANDASPTVTHRFIHGLGNIGKLVRSYTTNIDNLDEKVGLSADLCVRLHGSLRLLRCFTCEKTCSWDGLEAETLKGDAPLCPNCQQVSNNRRDEGKRPVAVGCLRPNVLLDNDANPQQEEIDEITERDASLEPDILLIFGTSLSTSGLKKLVGDFAKSIHKRGGKVILVNHTEPADVNWKEKIDYWFKWDCDDFVRNLTELVPELRPSTLSGASQNAQQACSQSENRRSPESDAARASVSSPPSDPPSLSDTRSSSPLSSPPSPLSDSGTGPPPPLPNPALPDIEMAGSLMAGYDLTVGQMGKNLANTIGDLLRRGVQNPFRVTGLPNIDWASHRENIIPNRGRVKAVQFSPGSEDGVCHLRSVKGTFDTPNFLEPGDRPSQEQVRDHLNALIDRPPEGVIPYLVGPSQFAKEINDLLHPGDALDAFSETEGVNTVYEHIGPENSGTAMHCEDLLLRSYNLGLFGWRAWIIIHETHTELFEDFVKRYCRSNGCHAGSDTCDQFVRHHDLFVSPRKLEEEGIEFEIICQGPGDIVHTRPRQLHKVFHLTVSAAIAINYTLPGEPAITSALLCRGCGFHPLTTKYKCLAKMTYKADKICRNKSRTKREARNAIEQPVEGPPKKRRRTDDELSQHVAELRKLGRLYSIPEFNQDNRPSPEVLKMAMTLRSWAAIDQFRSFVKKRRMPVEVLRVVSDNITERLKQHIQAIDSTEDNMLLIRLNQVGLAKCLDEEKQESERIRTSSDTIRSVCKSTGWSRDKFQYQAKKGRKWISLCRNYDGLLFFFLLDSRNPFQIREADYLSLKDDEIDQLHRLLDNEYTHALCVAGNAFQRSLEGKGDVEFNWENTETPLEEVQEKEMLHLLQPFPSITQNYYDKTSPFVRPKTWPTKWPWPTNPLELQPDEELCDYCPDGGSCECIVNILPRAQPHIKYFGGKGRGLQTVAENPGQRAYKEKEVIGFITGQVVPAGTYTDGWSVEFVRSIGRSRPKFQIYCGAMGNLFRLLNHSCEPRARFRPVRISGKLMIAVEALGDISDGEELTVYYRDNLGTKCLCGRC